MKVKYQNIIRNYGSEKIMMFYIRFNNYTSFSSDTSSTYSGVVPKLSV